LELALSRIAFCLVVVIIFGVVIVVVVIIPFLS
jgi:hypothetical protein